MFPRSLVIAGFALLSVLAAGQNAQEIPQISLKQYIESLHWNAAKSGPLIALETENTFGPQGAENGLAAFQRRLTKVGGISVIGLTWAIALDDSDLPNAYQALTSEEKMIYLLATLGPTELAKLTDNGLSPNDLAGEQREALLSMLPNPLRIVRGEVQGSGFTTADDVTTLTVDQANQMRLQLRKGVQVMFKATSDKEGGKSCQSLTSLDYAGPNGTPILRTPQVFDGPENSRISGRIVESAEKKSELDWTDARLARVVDLKDPAALGDLVGAVRETTGIEIYADVRIAQIPVTALGASASARDLLRGLTIAVEGVVRRVGPAFVLTANIEGEGTREARLQVRHAVGRIGIGAEVAQWKAEAAKRGLLDKIGFSKDDALGVASIDSNDIAQRESVWEANWVPLSHLPSAMQTAINQTSPDEFGQNSGAIAVPELANRVKVLPVIGFRFVMPDGRPLESRELLPWMIESSPNAIPTANPGLPLDPRTLRKGSAVGIKSDDPEVVAKLCRMISDAKMAEVWIDTEVPAAVQAAMESGLTVDLVVHPWRIMKGEACSDPDRNVLGQVGAQLNEIAGVHMNSASRWTTSYSNAFSAADPSLSAHWDRVLSMVRKSGAQHVVVLEPEAAGYQGTDDLFLGTFGEIQDGWGLHENAPSLVQFGYSLAFRLEFLRKHKIDPIDIVNITGRQLSTPNPYFDSVMFSSGKLGPYPEVEFPQSVGQIGDSISSSWNAIRHSRSSERIAEFLEKLNAIAKPVYVEQVGATALENEMTGIRGVARLGGESKSGITRFFPMNPLNTEDSQRNLIWKPYIPENEPICIDLSDVPPDRMPVYLRYIFKSENASASNESLLDRMHR